MYDTVQLRQEDWCLQCYIWQRDWDKSKIPEEKIIKTLISGVKSSGDQAEWGLREIAKLLTKEYPLINQIVQNDIYVDDCLSGENTEELAQEKADQIELVLNWGGFSLKGVTFTTETLQVTFLLMIAVITWQGSNSSLKKISVPYLAIFWECQWGPGVQAQKILAILHSD